MHSSTLRPIFSYSGLNKQILRTIKASSEAIGVNESESLKSWREIPGPKGSLILGTLRHFLPGGELYNLNGLELTQKLFKDYGPIIKLDGVFGREPLIFLFDAESSSQILRGENWLPVRPGFKSLEYYRHILKKDRNEGRPTGLITDQGELWRELRTTVNPVLLQPKTIRLYTTVLDEVALDMIERLKSIRDENNMIIENFDHEMNKWSLESIGVVALGCRLKCLEPNLPEDSPVKRLIQCVNELFVIANELDFKPSLWQFFATPTFKKAMKLYEEQETLSKIFIDRAIQEFKTKTKTNDEKGILEKLLEINEDFAHIMACDMLFAGVDTAANSITGALYLLAINPDKQKKLRDEVLSEPEKRSFLRACLREAIRMMPVASGNMRLTTKEYKILGYNIPSGTVKTEGEDGAGREVVGGTIWTHMKESGGRLPKNVLLLGKGLPRIWGRPLPSSRTKQLQVIFAHENMSLMEEHFPRANEYLPERWLADKDDPLYYRNAHPFAYNPFGFGARSCIGRRIAELEMETFLARMIENFHVEWIGEPPKVVQTSLNYIKGPYNFIFKDVQK